MIGTWQDLNERPALPVRMIDLREQRPTMRTEEGNHPHATALETDRRERKGRGVRRMLRRVLRHGRLSFGIHSVNRRYGVGR